VRVVLTYLDGVSNWGPRTASGVAEIVRAEGQARVTAHGVPATNGVHYIVWLTISGQPDAYRLGELSFLNDGTTVLDELLSDPIPNTGWNGVLVTAESSAESPRPGQRHTLAGRFQKPAAQGTQPTGLPNTGLGGGAIVGLFRSQPDSTTAASP
jgi:hypothetical protein